MFRKFLVQSGFLVSLFVFTSQGFCQEQSSGLSEKESQFQKLLTDSTLSGQFTMDGKPLSELQDETYEIRKVQKLAAPPDSWAIHARIKYGEHDVVLPVPVRILWAGDTPVITLDKMFLPGLGTYSARVVIHGNRYAGTWQHDETGGKQVGGHLFGTIEGRESDIEDAATEP
jgi:hypothetical protein